MRLLILERDHALYAALLMAADPSLKVVAGDDPLQLIDAASECSIWLGQPDLVAQMLRQGVHPVWVQSTWAGITPLLAADLPKDYSLTRAVGIFGQVMSEYLLTYMLAHERQFLGRLASQVGSQWDSRTPGGLRGRQVVIVRCSPGSSPRRCLSMPGVVSRWWTPTWWRHWRTTNWPAR